MKQIFRGLAITEKGENYKSADQVGQNFFRVIDSGNAGISSFQVIRHSGTAIENIPVKTDRYALVYCLQGTVVRTIDQFRFRIVPQSIHLVNPGSLNGYHQPSEDLELFVILFGKEFLSDSLIREAMIDNILEPVPGEPSVGMIKAGREGVIIYLFERLLTENNNQQPYSGQMQHLLFIELLLETIRSADCSHKNGDGRQPASRSKQLVGHYQKLVEENFLLLRSVQEYANLLFVTAKHLSEIVKQETGLTPLYLIHNRIFQQAKYLLCSSELTVKEIAEKLNFDTSSHFSRFFKHFTGYNPTDFQQIQCAII